MKTYFIEFERQGYLLAIVKVAAESYEEAKMKAAFALHNNDDVSEVSRELAMQHMKEEEMILIDEDGDEINVDDDVTYKAIKKIV